MGEMFFLLTCPLMSDSIQALLMSMALTFKPGVHRSG